MVINLRDGNQSTKNNFFFRSLACIPLLSQKLLHILLQKGWTNISRGNQANIGDISQRYKMEMSKQIAHILWISEKEILWKKRNKFLLFCPGFTCLTDYPEKWPRYQHLVCHNMNFSWFNDDDMITCQHDNIKTW